MLEVDSKTACLGSPFHNRPALDRTSAQDQFPAKRYWITHVKLGTDATEVKKVRAVRNAAYRDSHKVESLVPLDTAAIAGPVQVKRPLAGAS